MTLIVWGKKLELGIKEIDDQHKKLIGLINKADLSLQNKVVKRSDFEEILKGLLEYVRVHFTTEEKYFYKFDYEGTAEHLLQHANFTQKILKFKDRFDKEEDIGTELFDFLKAWLEAHLKVMDRKYVKCFKEHGLK